MYISELVVENFRCFGKQENKLVLPLQVGLNTLVGENDAGKTAILDALRVLLGTRDQENLKPTAEDFHIPIVGDSAVEFTIQAVFKNLELNEQARFADYLTYVPDNKDQPIELRITLNAIQRNGRIRTTIFSGLPTGSHGLKELDLETRDLIRATYLRPLRDAEKEMDSGRNSRISKILRKQSSINKGETEIDFDLVSGEKFCDVIDRLGVVGIAKLVNQLLEQQPAVSETTENLNTNFLLPLQMQGDDLKARLGIGSNNDDESLKKQMLEKIGISLEDTYGKRGLGSNNLLYIACEMLLLADSKEEVAVLIIEEPEAHLHPQRQLKLIQYLQQKVIKHENDHKVQLQIFLSTHSPTLASKLPIKSMTMIHDGKVFPFHSAKMIASDNCVFLERFIDATKSNLFFCRGLMIVEGDAENLLLPSISKIIGCDFTDNGVSIVNVGHTGLSRYANLFSGTDMYPNPGVRVACLHDLDLIPFTVAHELKLKSVDGRVELFSSWDTLKKLENKGEVGDFESLNKQLPKNVISNLIGNDKDKNKEGNVQRKYDGSFVKGFYSGPWTLECSLAFHGLAKEVTIAACLAKAEHSSIYNELSNKKIIDVAKKYYKHLCDTYPDKLLLAGKIYELFIIPVSVSDSINDNNTSLILKKEASKAAAGQHLGLLLENIDNQMSKDGKSANERIDYWKVKLPSSVVDAIIHVTPPRINSTFEGGV
jgi:putative ATP-dependent endonuclease of the OLD family